MDEQPIKTSPPILPPSYRKWSWGAMLLNVIWGAKYGIELAFLTLIPVLGLVIPFFLGYKGNQLAWETGKWQSVEHFEREQRNWAFWGVIIWIFIFMILFLPILFGVIHLKWQHSQIYQDAMQGFMKIEKIHTMLGDPIQGRVTSVKRVSSNAARFSVRVKGSRTHITVRFHVMKIDKKWSVYRMTLYHENGKSGIDFPLPDHMLLTSNVGNDSEMKRLSKQYNVVLKNSGNAEMYTLSTVLCDLNKKLDEKSAIELIRYAPKIICQGTTQIGALKIQRKLEDYGALVTIEKQQAAHE